MQEKLYLGVKNHATGDYFVAACSLPAQIGKQHDVNNQVLLDPKYRTISRIHGMIERTTRGFVYTDSSANGSRVGGLVVRDSRVALSSSFQIEIENYTISRVETHPFVVLSTNAELKELQSLELLPGRGFGLSVQVVSDPITAGNRVSTGSFGWDGAYGTHFWVDPKEKIVGILMIQTDNPNRQLDRDFENAVMQSIVE